MVLPAKDSAMFHLWAAVPTRPLRIGPRAPLFPALDRALCLTPRAEWQDWETQSPDNPIRAQRLRVRGRVVAVPGAGSGL